MTEPAPLPDELRGEGWECAQWRGHPTVHVLPLSDALEHDESDDWAACPCGPHVELLTKGRIVVHSSLDGRELAECL